MRLRAFGNYAYRIADPRLFYNEISGTRERYTTEVNTGQRVQKFRRFDAQD